MHARHVTIQGPPDKVDEAITSVREHVLPVLQSSPGFKGQLLLIDRNKGEAIGISLWDTLENLEASEDKVSGARQQAADDVGASAAPQVGIYELPIFETP